MTVQLKNVGKSVAGQIHIHPTSLDLRDGEFNVLLGPTLSGKTTLLRLMAGLDKPDAGEIWFSGDNVTATSVQQRNIAMVYQEFINYPNFSVFENIASPLRVAKINPTDIKKRVGEIAELLNLSNLLDRDVANLSGGQQQRTALARALVKDAPLVLLDEPLANLDYKLREQLREELPRLFAKSGSTVVYATSEPEEALMLGGYTATLHEGRVAQYGKTIEIYREPGNLACARIFSHPPINLAEVIKSKDSMTVNASTQWKCPLALKHCPDGRYFVGIRPHHLTLSASERGDSCEVVSGEVKLAEISGSESLVHLLVHDNDWISQSHGVHQYAIGEQVEVCIDFRRCLFFDHAGNAVVY